MTLEHLRHKVRDRTPLYWPSQRCFGLVTRVARDGTWADMVWAHDWHSLYSVDPEWTDQWRKRQPLSHLGEWEHA